MRKALSNQCFFFKIKNLGNEEGILFLKNAAHVFIKNGLNSSCFKNQDSTSEKKKLWRHDEACTWIMFGNDVVPAKQREQLKKNIYSISIKIPFSIISLVTITSFKLSSSLIFILQGFFYEVCVEQKILAYILA